MSETIEIETGTRRARQPRERSMSDDEPGVTLIEDGEPAPEGISPEDALAEAQRAIADRDVAIAAANDRASRAEREAQRAHVARQQGQGAAIAAAVEAATASQAQARQALKQAREAGDIDAEADATQALSQATYRLEAANAALSQARNAEPTSAAGQTTEPQQGGVSQQTQAWIARHPRFNSEPAYKQTLLSAHFDLMKDGVAPDSPAYFRELDRVAAQLEGGGRQVPNDPPQRQAFDGAPPTRGTPSSGAGGNTVQTALGPVTVIRGAGGKVSVKVPDHLRSDFEEGARICGMSLGDYIYDQFQCAQIAARGGDNGLRSAEGREGRTYR